MSKIQVYFRSLVGQFKTASILLVTFIFLTGIVYPLVITGFGNLFFPFEAKGSLIQKNQILIGSELIGQYFDTEDYFWSRPSATTPNPYNATASTGSNLGPTNSEITKIIQIRIEMIKKSDPENTMLIPLELVTASGSGLDPHISPLACEYQVERISKKRHLSKDQIRKLIDQYTEKRQFGFLGEPRVNVLKLNLALDNLSLEKMNGKSP